MFWDGKGLEARGVQYRSRGNAGHYKAWQGMAGHDKEWRATTRRGRASYGMAGHHKAWQGMTAFMLHHGICRAEASMTLQPSGGPPMGIGQSRGLNDAAAKWWATDEHTCLVSRHAALCSGMVVH